MADQHRGLPHALAALRLAYMRPTPEERDEINRIMMEELACGVFEAVVLGSTESDPAARLNKVLGFSN